MQTMQLGLNILIQKVIKVDFRLLRSVVDEGKTSLEVGGQFLLALFSNNIHLSLQYCTRDNRQRRVCLRVTFSSTIIKSFSVGK